MRALTLVAVAASLLAVPAAAEAPQPQQIRKFLAEYGACIVKREPELAVKAVLGDQGFNRNTPEGRLLLQRECIDANELRNGPAGFVGRLRMGPDFYRGAIADALVARTPAAAPSFAAVPALTYVEPWAVRTTDKDGKALSAEAIARQQAGYDRRAADVRRARLAECVTRAAGAQVRAMLATAIDTPAELDALKAVAPAMGPCMPAGMTAGFDRMTLRGALAVAYLRLASAATPGSAG